MPILTGNADDLNEIRFMLDPSITDVEVPDETITARPILRAANRWVLHAVGMNEAEYDALPQDDIRREIFEEAVIRRATEKLTPIVAQLVSSNANGIYTQYQVIDWIKRGKQLASENQHELKPYLAEPGFYTAITKDKVKAEPRSYRNRYRYY